MRPFVAMLIPIFIIFGAAKPIYTESPEGSYLPRYCVLVVSLPPLEAASIDNLNNLNLNNKGAFFDRRHSIRRSDPSVFPIA
jgi:hypothetical protein